MQGKGICPFRFNPGVLDGKQCIKDQCELWLSHNEAWGMSCCAIKGTCIQLECIRGNLNPDLRNR